MHNEHTDRGYALILRIVEPRSVALRLAGEERDTLHLRDLACSCIKLKEKSYPIRELDKIFHENARHWYAQRGQSRHCGVMLYGLLDTGKTSLVSAIAACYRLRILQICQSNHRSAGKLLIKLFEVVQEYDLVLIENIDCAGMKFSRESEKAISDDEISDKGSNTYATINESDSSSNQLDTAIESLHGPQSKQMMYSQQSKLIKANVNQQKDEKPKKTRSSNTMVLSGLLIALDGATSPQGHVVFMTSDHPEKLDPARLCYLGIATRLVLYDVCSTRLRRESDLRCDNNPSSSQNVCKPGSKGQINTCCHFQSLDDVVSVDRSVLGNDVLL